MSDDHLISVETSENVSSRGTALMSLEVSAVLLNVSRGSMPPNAFANNQELIVQFLRERFGDVQDVILFILVCFEMHWGLVVARKDPGAPIAASTGGDSLHKHSPHGLLRVVQNIPEENFPKVQWAEYGYNFIIDVLGWELQNYSNSYGFYMIAVLQGFVLFSGCISKVFFRVN